MNTGISDAIVVALIAGSISLAVSTLGLLATFLTNAANRRRLEKEIQHKFTEKLYNIRLEVYPEAFEITSYITRQKPPAKINTREELLDIREKLLKWNAGKAALVLSKDSLEAFRNLVQLLKRKHGLQTEYSEEQIQKLWTARSRFRGCLRSDLGLLSEEASSRQRR